ncbi:MAG: sodium:solute symporter family protein [Myxococcales bacterium]|nr:sodium:solute symporter family protein [Myxococcales bacterium]
MMLLGYIGMRRVKSGDDFATARGAYGPIFLAFALTATTASGGTFIGIPALAYQTGFSSLWYAFVYPLGVYTGLILCLRGIRRAGAAFGTRSMPEYLGDRYDSEAMRICAALFSMLLLFYLAGQLLAGAVMFNKMMGVDLFPALFITAVIIMIYIVIGGAHADILTDGIQGALMLLLSIAVAVMFSRGFGVEGGFDGLISTLKQLDPDLTKVLHPTHPVLNSRWDVFALFMMHAPLGLLPHVGNKLWALKSDRDQRRFIVCSFAFGMILPMMVFGGIAARAVLGDALLAEGASANDAIPALFIATLPSWLAALIGAGVLAAIMSTADGLIVSTSQIFANDIYRRTIAPRLAKSPSDARIDSISLLISRVAAVLVVVGSMWLAWESQTMNVALLIAAGVGGMIAAICGPMFAGILWRGATKAGAISGFVAGGASFIILKTGWLEAEWFAGGVLEIPGGWLASQAPNAFSCGTLGALTSVAVMVVVSWFTQRPSEEHLRRVFGD